MRKWICQGLCCFAIVCLAPAAEAAPTAQAAAKDEGLKPLAGLQRVEVTSLEVTPSSVANGGRVKARVWMTSNWHRSVSKNLHVRCIATTGRNECPFEEEVVSVHFGPNRSKTHTVESTGWKPGNYQIEAWFETSAPWPLVSRAAVQVAGVVRPREGARPAAAASEGHQAPQSKSKSKGTGKATAKATKKGGLSKSGGGVSKGKASQQLHELPAPDLGVTAQLSHWRLVWPLQARVTNASVAKSPASTMEIRVERLRFGEWRELMRKEIAVPSLGRNERHVVQDLGGERIECPRTRVHVGGRWRSSYDCRVVVTVDSKQEVSEADESNNVQVLETKRSW